ncbi:helix-turn-helix transcriptional regulator [Burkholderia perseverans]|uniref:helix-turn-helix transcriptional regulator n=1 Tax=Burkholderia perseverans TaxID=2615214 RepID=UPI001FED5889|nr:AlpA family phage regulatory protein [Burkholderia perseverans]
MPKHPLLQPKTITTTLPAPKVLPFDGFSRWADLQPFIPMSRESVRLRELDGRFPKRVQLGSARCVAWPNSELHRYFADPANYRASDAPREG